MRYLEYEFPHSGFEKEVNAFMLGGDYLVVPAVQKTQKQPFSPCFKKHKNFKNRA